MFNQFKDNYAPDYRYHGPSDRELVLSLIHILTVGQRIALMHEGKMQMLDTPANVYNRPANVFTAKFIGSPSMNIVEASYTLSLIHI